MVSCRNGIVVLVFDELSVLQLGNGSCATSSGEGVPENLDVGAINGDTEQPIDVNQNGNGNQERQRRDTSSPSGRSASVHSGKSDASRRRIESDTVKEPSARYSISQFLAKKNSCFQSFSLKKRRINYKFQNSFVIVSVIFKRFFVLQKFHFEESSSTSRQFLTSGQAS
jgi:hypothetical protein